MAFCNWWSVIQKWITINNILSALNKMPGHLQLCMSPLYATNITKFEFWNYRAHTLCAHSHCSNTQLQSYCYDLMTLSYTELEHAQSHRHMPKEWAWLINHIYTGKLNRKFTICSTSRPFSTSFFIDIYTDLLCFNIARTTTDAYIEREIWWFLCQQR